MKHTKIVCTLGPSTADRIVDLIHAGLDVARVNFSHGTREQHERLFAAVREGEAQVGRPVAILADLSGPKIRLGSIAPDPLALDAGGTFVLRSADGPGDVRGASTTHPELTTDLEPGDRVLLADGAVELRVHACDDGEVVTEIVRGGRIRSHVGVNVPSERLSLPAVTAKDRDDLRRAVELGADLIAQSFVREPDDVRALRACLPDRQIRVVAKIETRPAVKRFEELCVEADAVMIARGDLGVEMAFEALPVLQKDLVRTAVRAGTPVIVATQMLESMTTAPRPTRAEASDVANAVLDGADAILLSAETAIGRHPLEATQAACRIAETAEYVGGAYIPEGERGEPGSEPQAIARAAAALAESDPRVDAIACFTRTGRTAALLSAVRPRVAIHAFSPDPAVVRRLTLHRGVFSHPAALPSDTDEMIGEMDAGLRRTGAADERNLVVMVASTPVGRANTNLLKLHRIGA